LIDLAGNKNDDNIGSLSTPFDVGFVSVAPKPIDLRQVGDNQAGATITDAERAYEGKELKYASLSVLV